MFLLKGLLLVPKTYKNENKNYMPVQNISVKMYVSIYPHKSLADQDSRHIIQWTLLFYFMVSFMGNLSDVNIFQGNEPFVKCTILSGKLMLIVLHSREALYQQDDKIERNMRKTMPGDRMHYCVILITKPGGVNSRLGHKRTVVFVCTFHLRFTF